MSEEKEPVIRVKDRRMFNPDGSLRQLDPEDLEEASTTPQPVHEVKPAEAAPAPAPERQPEADDDWSDAADSFDETGPPPRPGEPSLFNDLIVNLASQAAMYMGLVDNPLGPQFPKDMQAARQMIDIIGMLKEKTKGNLTSEEALLTERILTDLRMQYVSMATTSR